VYNDNFHLTPLLPLFQENSLYGYVFFAGPGPGVWTYALVPLQRLFMLRLDIDGALFN
jgi:hypothetical protein